MSTAAVHAGGLVTAYHVECAADGCTGRTSPQPSAAHAWAEARGAGWQVPPAGWPPLCAAHRPGPIGHLFHA